MADQGKPQLTDGVSAAALRAFLEELKRAFPDSYQDMTTEDTKKKFVVPRTEQDKCAYIDLLRGNSSSDVGKATVFVSHAWRHKTVDVLDVLLKFAKEQEGKEDGVAPFFWFDIFTINQNEETTDLPQDWWSTKFKDSIASIGRVLLVLMPWDDPVPLTRAWCLWEIFCGISNEDTEVDIRLPQREEKALEEAIVGNFDAVIDTLVRVDAQRARAGKPKDKEMIFQAIETSAGGFGVVNQAIKDRLRKWCLSKAVAAVETMERRGKDGTVAFANLCHQVGVVLEKFRDTDRAIKHFEKAHAISVDELGPKHPLTTRTYNALGAAYINKGEYDKAIAFLERARQILMDLLGEEDPNTVTAVENLGVAYRGQGTYDKAIEYLEKALAIRKRLSEGKKHPAIARTYNNLGNAYDCKGEHDKVIRCYEKACEIKVETLGEKHPSTAASYLSLGIAYRRKDEYDKAIELFKKARENFAETLGETHPSTAEAYTNLGSAYSDKGEYDKAIEYNEKARAIRVETLGEKHPSTASTYNNLGNAYSSKGEYDKAIAYFEKDLAITRETLGEKHPNTAGIYNSLGNAYADKGEYDKAIEYYEKSLAITRETLGEKHRSTADTYGNLGIVYKNKGEYDKAIEYYEKACEIYVKTLGEKHPNTGNTYGNVGSTYRTKGEYDQAIAYLEKALEIYEATVGKKHPSTAEIYNNLGAAYSSKGEYNKAIECFEEAREIYVETLGEKHPSTADTYNNLGIAYKSMGEFDKAIENHEKERDIRVQTLGEKHPGTADVYNNLGVAYAGKGEYDKAIEQFKKARGIEAETLAGTHSNTAAGYLSLGNAYRSKGDYDKAMEYFIKAREIMVETLGEKHPDTAMTLGNIGLLHRDRGDTEQATEYTQRALDIFEETLGSQHPHTRQAKATLQQLLRHGSDAMQPKQGKSSLLTACRDGNMDVLSSLLRQGENPSQRDDNGNTPLHIACHLNHRDAAETLLQHGADPSLTNSKGETPLDVARSRDNTSVLRLLRSSRLDTVAGYDEGKKQHNQPDNGAGGEADEMLLAKQQKEKAQQLKKRGILEQMKRMAERGDAEPCNRAKLMLVGEGRSGKTTTLNSLLGKAFTPSLTSTRGATEDDLHVTVNARDVFLWKELRGNSSETAHHLLRACLGDPSAMNEYRRQQIQKAVGRKRTSTEQQVKRDWQQESIHWNEEDWQPTSAGFGAAQHEAAPAVSDDDPLFHAQSSRRRPRHRSRRRRRLPDAPTPTPPAMGRTDLEKVIEDVDISAALDDCIGRLIFKIFDLGGQSTFYIFHPLFLTEYAIYLLVFSMADMLHKNEAKRVETWDFIEYWLTSLHLHANGASILIVGTYADVFAERSQHESISREMNERFLDHPAFDNVVENKKGELCFWPVDNTQSENDPMIQNLRTTVSATAMEQEYVSQKVALPYLQLYDKMMEVYKTQNKPLVTLDEVVELARTCGLPTRDETVECLRFLHLYSMLLYYDSVEGMEQFVILSPQWAADLMTRVIRNFDLHRDVQGKEARKVGKKPWTDLIDRGILHRKMLAVLWNDVPEDLRQPFLELMMRFGLCVRYTIPLAGEEAADH